MQRDTKKSSHTDKGTLQEFDRKFFKSKNMAKHTENFKNTKWLALSRTCFLKTERNTKLKP